MAINSAYEYITDSSIGSDIYDFVNPDDGLLPPVEMAPPAPGNVADTQIVQDYNEEASNARQCGNEPPNRCDWLEQNKHRYRDDQVKATQKAWGCRRSRQNR